MNNWGIPDWLEQEVRERDTSCVYCGEPMIQSISQGGDRRTLAPWEHIINDASIISRENIARCCSACNSSKGTKELSQWMESEYCKSRGISKNTVADVVKHAFENQGLSGQIRNNKRTLNKSFHRILPQLFGRSAHKHS